jgi:hypothetical protein
MNKKILSLEISEGINKSIVGYTIKILVMSFAIAFFIMFFLSLIGNYQTHKFEEEYCGGNPCPISPVNNCNFENLYCRILVNCGSVNYQYTSFQACGYQEANAEFEILKPKIIDDIKSKDYRNNETWHNQNCKLIDYLECD